MLWVRIFTQSAVLLSIRFNALCIAMAHAIHNQLLGWEHSERTCFATCHAMPCHEFNGVFRVMFSSPFGRPHRWHWAQCTAHSGPLHSHHCHVVWFSGFRLSSVAEHVHGVRWWTVKITQEKKIVIFCLCGALIYECHQSWIVDCSFLLFRTLSIFHKWLLDDAVHRFAELLCNCWIILPMGTFAFIRLEQKKNQILRISNRKTNKIAAPRQIIHSHWTPIHSHERLAYSERLQLDNNQNFIHAIVVVVVVVDGSKPKTSQKRKYQPRHNRKTIL